MVLSPLVKFSTELGDKYNYRGIDRTWNRNISKKRMESESDSIPLDSKKRSRQISSQPHERLIGPQLVVIVREIFYFSDI